MLRDFTRFKCRAIEAFKSVADIMDTLAFIGPSRRHNVMQAINAYEMLTAKLDRFGDELKKYDYGDPVLFKFCEKLNKTLEQRASIDDVRAGLHKSITFEECFELLNPVVDDVLRNPEAHEDLCRMIRPFQLLKQWYDDLDPELKNYCERTNRREFYYSCPYMSVRRCINPMAFRYEAVKALLPKGAVIITPN